MGPFWSVSVGGRAWEKGAGGGVACPSYTEADAYWLEITSQRRLLDTDSSNRPVIRRYFG